MAFSITPNALLSTYARYVPFDSGRCASCEDSGVPADDLQDRRKTTATQPVDSVEISAAAYNALPLDGASPITGDASAS